MCCSLARASIPVQSPEMLFSEGWAPGFKEFRLSAHKLATLPVNSDCWGVKYFANVLKSATTAEALESIYKQRNDFAHGRATMPLAEVKKLVFQALQIDSWGMISEVDGELRVADWAPWIATSADVDRGVGLFERWEENVVRYLVPETGQVFESGIRS
jgi:hypothetical protein